MLAESPRLVPRSIARSEIPASDILPSGYIEESGLGASVEASEEEEDMLLLVRSWIRGLEMCVKFGALFGSAPEVVAEGLENIVKEIVRIIGEKQTCFYSD